MKRSAKKPRYDYTMLTVIFLLVTIGLILLYSTSAYNGMVKFQDPYYYLKKQGYCIVERNYYTPYGEIDIIAQQDKVLVFVEIKYRSNRRYGAATDAVDHRKQWRISKSAMYYYAYHGYEEQRPCRFDVITVQGSAVTHIQDAFDYCG